MNGICINISGFLVCVLTSPAGNGRSVAAVGKQALIAVAIRLVQ